MWTTVENGSSAQTDGKSIACRRNSVNVLFTAAPDKTRIYEVLTTRGWNKVKQAGTNTGLFEMIVGVLTTCHTEYTWDRSICISLFNRTTLQVFVTYLTGDLHVHPLWFYKHQHDNRVRSKLFVACQRWWFQWRFWFATSVPGYLREEEEHKPDPWRNPIERNKKYIYSYLKFIVYDKLLKPRQSFRITLYFRTFKNLNTRG